MTTRSVKRQLVDKILNALNYAVQIDTFDPGSACVVTRQIRLFGKCN